MLQIVAIGLEILLRQGILSFLRQDKLFVRMMK